MRINTNVASLVAQENAANTSFKTGSSLEKLSSGLRINKAADDASGLAIADKLRTQATSIDQGITNGNSAITLLQIADKSMSEQSNILDTVKAKLIQANTDTTSDDGREAIRKDISKLLEQLDNIAEQTNYNGNVLLQSAAGDTAAARAGSADLNFQIGESKNDIISNIAVQSNTLGLGNSNVAEVNTITLGAQAAGNIKLDLDGTAVTLDLSTTDGTVDDIHAKLKAAVEASGQAANFTVSDQSAPGNTSFVITSNTRNVDSAVSSVSTAGALTTPAALAADAVGVTQSTAGVAQTGTIAFNAFAGADGDTAAVSIDGTEYEVDATSLDAGGVAIGDTATAAKVAEALKVVIDAAGTGFTADVTTTPGSIILTAAAPGANVTLVGETNVDGSTPIVPAPSAVTAGVADVLGKEEFSITPAAGEVYELSLGGTPDVVSYTGQTGDDATAIAAGLQAAATAGGFADYNITSSGAGKLTVEAATSAINTGAALEATVNVTPANTDSGNATNVTTTAAGDPLVAMSLEDLKDLATDGLTRELSDSYQAVVDDAITDLNGFRGDIGSTQNQVESAVRNLMTQSTNVKAAESIIRDVDYAAESANFNKQNIIAQAGTYAMSQANSAAQNVLRLLQ